MIILLVTKNKEDQLQQFSCKAHSVENAFNVASYISTQARQIVEAFLIDEGKKTRLPVETFDGESFSTPIQQLEKEWLEILSKPVNVRHCQNQWLAFIFRQRIDRNQARIDQLTKAISQVEQTLQRIHDTVFHESRCCQLLARNGSILSLLQLQLAHAQADYETALNRLNILNSSTSYLQDY